MAIRSGVTQITKGLRLTPIKCGATKDLRISGVSYDVVPPHTLRITICAEGGKEHQVTYDELLGTYHVSLNELAEE